MKKFDSSKYMEYANESSKVFTVSTILIFSLFILNNLEISCQYILLANRVFLTLLIAVLFPINFTRELLKFKENFGLITYNHEIYFSFLNMIYLGLFYYIQSLKFLNYVAIVFCFLVVLYMVYKMQKLKPNHYMENIRAILMMSLFLVVFYIIIIFYYNGPIYFS